MLLQGEIEMCDMNIHYLLQDTYFATTIKEFRFITEVVQTLIFLHLFVYSHFS